MNLVGGDMSPSTARLVVVALLAVYARPAAVSVQDLRKVRDPKPVLTDVRVVDTTCKPEEIRKFFAPATREEPEVRLGCRLSIKPGQTITKRILFRGKGASGAMLDCGGSTIIPTFTEGVNAENEIYEAPAVTIQSNSGKASDGSPDTPSGVTIRDCVIHGRVVISSRQIPGSDKRAGHTARMQAQAPRNITLDRLTIIGRGGDLVYFQSGVTRSTLSNSDLRGRAGMAIYLDAESAHNTIIGNYIHPEAPGRELISIDGSAHNRIVGNRFSSLNKGGIYLYRNCGELGVIRHQLPRHNEIINNHFYYLVHNDDDYPAIWVGSRNEGRTADGNIGYCDDDEGYPFGSSASDFDFADHTAIAENRISRIDGWGYDEFFRINDQPTYVIRNVRVSNDEIALLDKSSMRRSGCFRLGLLLSPGLSDRGVFVRDGQYVRNLNKNTQSLDSLKTGVLSGRLRCNDGIWVDGGETQVARVSDQANKSNDNDGGHGVASCPAGKRIVAFRASCNLELEAVPGLSMVPWNHVQVRQKSDRVEDGTCAVSYRWSADENRTVSINQGSATLEELLSAHVTEAGLHCRDFDQNGGDCYIRAEAICM
jgi:parallel beta-helix repeat protein